MAWFMGKGRNQQRAFGRAQTTAVHPKPNFDLCRNCGARAESLFCPDCGQSTKVGIPRLHELLHEGFGAFFSYDAKIWRTLVVLVSQPGQLTLDYIDGKRVRYLTPFQLFFWLQAIAFVSHRVFFSQDPREIDLKTKALLVVGIVFVVGLAIMNVTKKLNFLVHLIAGTHIWSFLMLVLLVEYTAIPPIIRILEISRILPLHMEIGRSLTLIAQIIMSVYLMLSILRLYCLSTLWAVIQTASLFGLYRLVAVIIDKTWA